MSFLINPYIHNSYYPTQSLDIESGSNQRLQIPHTDFTAGGAYSRSKCAWSFWIKPESTSSGGVTSKAVAAGNHEWRIRYDGGAGQRIRCFFSSAGDATNGSGSSSDAIVVDSWGHVLIHFDRANATSSERYKMWINGVAQTIDSYTAPSLDLQTTTSPAVIGAWDSSGDQPFDGKVYQFAMFSNYLPTISEVYNSGHPVDVRNVTGLFCLLDVAGGSPVSDFVLASDWTNTNGVTASADIPA